MRRVVGMGRVLARMFVAIMFIMRVLMSVFVVHGFGRYLGGGRLYRPGGRAGFRFRDRARYFASGIRPLVGALRLVIVVVVRIMIVRMVVIMTMRVMIMRPVVVMGRVLVMFGVVRMRLAGIGAVMQMCVAFAFIGLGRLRRILAGALDDAALDAVAMAAAAGVAVARPATVAVVGGAVLTLFLRLAVGAFVGLDQRLTVGDRDLIIIRVDFAERQEAMAVAAIFDERRLQRRLYARDLGEVDIAAELFALGGLEIKFFDAVAADHNDPGLFRVGSVDQHLVGHFGTLDGGGRGAWRAQIARPGDATVHLIRG
jgi:hypothetical protein